MQLERRKDREMKDIGYRYRKKVGLTRTDLVKFFKGIARGDARIVAIKAKLEALEAYSSKKNPKIESLRNYIERNRSKIERLTRAANERHEKLIALNTSNKLKVEALRKIAHERHAKFAEIGIDCVCLRSSQMNITGKSDAKLAGLIASVGRGTYVSGGGGANYQSEKTFAEKNIQLIYANFVPEAYPQKNSSEFIPRLGVLDALFNIGADQIGDMFRALGGHRSG